MKDEEPLVLLPDIEEYLETAHTSFSISVPANLEELVYKMHAATGIGYEASKEILRLFFQEIRNTMLRGDIISFNGFGDFIVSNPSLGYKTQIIPTFLPHNLLRKKMNGRK